MLLTISTTHMPATDLGYLLHKRPDRLQTFDLTFGKAHVFYPEATDARCTAALMLDVDPIGLVRGKNGAEGAQDQYVNDRPYVASSFLSVAIAQVFGSALSGKSRERADVAELPIPLVARLSAMPCRGGEALLQRLFAPLGYTLTAERQPLDPHYPDWGDSLYYRVTLDGTARLSDLLSHLYVLIPVLDDDKHYYFGDDEVEKLLRHGAGWLAAHPERDLITTRYLKRRSLVNAALARLVIAEAATDPDDAEEAHGHEEEAIEKPLTLNTQRIGTVVAALKGSGAKRVLDLGCGEGQLVAALLDDLQFEEIVGMDVSHRALEMATRRLRLDSMPDKRRERVKLIQGSLSYRDSRLAGYDAAAVVEVIEHLDPPRLAAFERVLFEFARPNTVIVTTPNAEYNRLFETLPAGQFRHKDHRFEWTRAEFEAWANTVAARFGYSVRYLPIGTTDPNAGAPTQMAVFRL